MKAIIFTLLCCLGTAAVSQQVKPARPLSSFDDLDAAGIGVGHRPYVGFQPEVSKPYIAPLGRMLDYDKIVATKKPPVNKDFSVDDLLAAGYRYTQAQPEQEVAKPPAKLGPIDKWRFESCRKEAAQAPTERGVGVGLHLCREKFGQ